MFFALNRCSFDGFNPHPPLRADAIIAARVFLG